MLMKNPKLPSLMLQEIDALHELSHANIVKVNELMEDGENYYIVTEIMEGGELFDRLIKVKKFSEMKAADILR